MGRIEKYEDMWTGYLLKFGDKVPGIQEDLAFALETEYQIGMLYTQGPITLNTGDYPVGQIAHIKKDYIGVHVTVSLDIKELPEPLLKWADRLVWSYTVNTPEIIYELKDNPHTGEKQKVLVAYPLLSVGYKIGGLSNGVQASGAVINRPTARRRKSVVSNRATGNDS